MAKKLRGQYSKQTKAESRATVKAQLKADFKSGRMKMSKNEVPLGGVSKAVLKYATRTGARIIADRKGAQIIAEKAARKKNPVVRNPKDDLRKDTGGSGGGNTYRAPGRNNKPRLRDTDDTSRKTTVRQKAGPKTKSGKFTEKKYKKTNTQPPARTKTKAEEPKIEIPNVIKFKGRVIAVRKFSANPRIRKREEAQLRIGRREYKAERARQDKLTKRRESGKSDTSAKSEIVVYSKSGKKYTVSVPKSSKGSGAKEVRPSQTTIDSRLASGSEKLPLTSRNQVGTDRMPPAEWRRYAEILRNSRATSPNVSPQQIVRGRARALMPTAERRAREIQAIKARGDAAANRRGLTPAQIEAIKKKAKAEAAYIARKAAN
jgi:hypothetical protein